MRIAMIVNNYPPKVGGVEYHVQNLARELARLGHKIWVLNIAQETGVRSDQGIDVITGKAYLPIADVITVPGLGTTGKIAHFLTQNKIDVVSIHTRFFPMSFVGLRAAQKAGIPVIHTEHGSGFVATKNPIVWLGSRVIDLTMGRYILRHATKVLGVSEAVTAFISRLSNRDADVFYNAITPPNSDITCTDRPHHLVFVGRMVEGKGWDTFIDAIIQLRAENHDVTGELIGDGPMLAKAQERIINAGLQDWVKTVGRVSPEEVRQRLAGATLVNPTVLSEGFQTTLVEALSVTGRVVTFPVPGAQMLKDHGFPVKISAEKTTSYLVETLKKFFRDVPSAGITEEIVKFTWPYQAQAYEQLCASILQHKISS